MLNWSLYQNPLAGSAHYLTLSDHFEFDEAIFGTARIGGFGDARAVLYGAGLTKDLVRDAARNWLMKELRLYDANGKWAYQGFVGEITATYGHDTWKRQIGWIANSIRAVYRKRDPLRPNASRKKYATAQDADSQALYGKRQLKLDLTQRGIMKAAQAQLGANRLLAKYKDFIFDEWHSEFMEPSIELGFFGYFYTLQWNAVLKRFVKKNDIAVIIQRVLEQTSEVQFITQDFANLETTGNTLSYNTDGMRMPPQDYIIETIANGDVNGRRLSFQIWEDRTPYLSAAPTLINVRGETGDARIWDANHSARPGYLVRAGDFRVSEDLNEDIAVAAYPENALWATQIEMTEWDDLGGKLVTKSADLDGVENELGRLGGKNRVPA